MRVLTNLTPTVTLDGFLRYVGNLPALGVKPYAELNLRLPSLDEVFLTLTGHRAEDDELEREGSAA